MGRGNFSEELKRDALAQITERGYPVGGISKRLGVSQHLLYEWTKTFAKAAETARDDRDAKICHLKRKLARVTEERDILKKLPLISPRIKSEIRVRRRATHTVFGEHNVSLPAHPSKWLICLVQQSPEYPSKGRCVTDRAHPRGME